MRGEEAAGEPTCLDLAAALDLYAAIIGGTPRQAADQLRDQGTLEGALGRPRSNARYEEADIALQAAVLAHGIAEGQAFVDANKRMALVAMLTFLELNGHRVEASDPRTRRLDPRLQRRPYAPAARADPPRSDVTDRS